MAIAVLVCITVGCDFTTQDVEAAVAHVDENDHRVAEQVWKG